MTFTPSIYFPNVWLGVVERILDQGFTESPRGLKTLELRHQTIAVDIEYPVLTIPQRKLSYQFMAAEAHWILSGDDRVSEIAPWNKHIEKFSDDGVRFFGAYGPKIAAQLPYVVNKLVADPDSRQAGLTIWRESPPPTKDVPCTVAIFFSIRANLLDVHVFMRSSDAWLGLPYDVFNFSMLGLLVCSMLNLPKWAEGHNDLWERLVKPGTLHLTMVSSHLYETNFEAARACLSEARSVTQPRQRVVPSSLWGGLDPFALLEQLRLIRDSSPGDPVRWWETSGPLHK